MNWQEQYPSDTRLERFAYNVITGLQVFTADDLHVLEAEIEAQGRDRRVIGSILKHFERIGLISQDGYQKSSRRECHGRPIVRWRVHL